MAMLMAMLLCCSSLWTSGDSQDNVDIVRSLLQAIPEEGIVRIQHLSAAQHAELQSYYREHGLDEASPGDRYTFLPEAVRAGQVEHTIRAWDCENELRYVWYGSGLRAALEENRLFVTSAGIKINNRFIYVQTNKNIHGENVKLFGWNASEDTMMAAPSIKKLREMIDSYADKVLSIAENDYFVELSDFLVNVENSWFVTLDRKLASEKGYDKYNNNKYTDSVNEIIREKYLKNAQCSVAFTVMKNDEPYRMYYEIYGDKEYAKKQFEKQVAEFENEMKNTDSEYAAMIRSAIVCELKDNIMITEEKRDYKFIMKSSEIAKRGNGKNKIIIVRSVQ